MGHGKVAIAEGSKATARACSNLRLSSKYFEPEPPIRTIAQARGLHAADDDCPGAAAIDRRVLGWNPCDAHVPSRNQAASVLNKPAHPHPSLQTD